MSMKAARFYGAKDIRVEEIPEPQPGPGQVKLQVAWCGICGSDLHEYLAGPILCPSLDTPHPVTGEKLPVTLGHEYSGTIISIGDGVDGNEYPIGKNAIVEGLLDCNEPDCPACTSGTHNLCERLTIIGFSGSGGLARWITVPAHCIHILPDSIPLDVAACLEPLAVAWYAVKRAKFQPGQTCLVVGGGPIGLFVIKVLKSLGCSWVGLSEPAKTRREKSLALGVSLALDPLASNVVSEVRKQSQDGLGVDIAFECSGNPAGLDVAISVTKPRGTIMNISLWESYPEVNVVGLVARERTLTGSCCYIGVHKEVIEAVASGKIKGLEDLITKRIALEDVVKEGFESLIHDKNNQIKILVSPTGVSPS